jgi:hypothetical protein
MEPEDIAVSDYHTITLDGFGFRRFGTRKVLWRDVMANLLNFHLVKAGQKVYRANHLNPKFCASGFSGLPLSRRSPFWPSCSKLKKTLKGRVSPMLAWSFSGLIDLPLSST